MSEEKSTEPKRIGNNKCFGGFTEKYECTSTTLGNTKAKFCVYIPPQASESNPVPILYFLSGLTCTEDNFITKSGAPQYASKYGIALICPDTSARGIDIKGDSDHWDFGTGAGFYVNALQKQWLPYYKMYDYIVNELPNILKSIDKFSKIFDFNNVSIFGHSMGGHGALMIYLKNLLSYKSCTAFAPVCNPVNCKWGQKAFNGYLGNKENYYKEWVKYDALELVKNLSKNDKDIINKNVIIIDQGTDDFAVTMGDDNHDQLRVKEFEETCKSNGVNVRVRYNEGYGHGYDHIATKCEDHIKFHAKVLNKNKKKSLVDTVDGLIEYVTENN